MSLFESIYKSTLSKKFNEAYNPAWDNWKDSGKSLPELLAEYLSDSFLNKTAKEDMEAETYPFFTDEKGIDHDGSDTGNGTIWVSVLDAANAVVSGDLDEYLRDSTRRTENAAAAARNILMAICGFDNGYKNDDGNSGSLRITGYGVKWDILSNENLSENWQKIYEYFHDNPYARNRDLQDELAKIIPDFRQAANVRKEQYEDMVNAFIQAIPTIDIIYKKIQGVYSFESLQNLQSLLAQHAKETDAAYAVAGSIMIDKLLSNKKSKINDAIKGTSFKSRDELIDFCKNTLSKNGLSKLMDDLTNKILEIEAMEAAHAKAEAERKAAKERAEEEDRQKKEKEKKEREKNEIKRLIQNYYASLDNYNKSLSMKGADIDKDGTIHFTKRGVSYTVPKPAETVDEYLINWRGKDAESVADILQGAIEKSDIENILGPLDEATQYNESNDNFDEDNYYFKKDYGYNIECANCGAELDEESDNYIHGEHFCPSCAKRERD